MTEVDDRLAKRRHILLELGFTTKRVGDELHGSAVITPEMHVPGTSRLRTSILATWSDTIAGLLSGLVMHPRVPVTLELDINLYRPAPSTGEVRAVGRTVKAGRSVVVAEIEFSCDDVPFAFGAASFMAAPNPDVRVSRPFLIDLPRNNQRLTMPLAERAQCERRSPGVAVLPRTEEGLNAANTINGGLISLAAEEAVLSLAPGRTLCSLGLRYLQPARVGPLVATATLREGVGRVELRDSGSDNRMVTLATVRTFDEP
ncbi:hotdog domain-containing protein [Nocardia alni]|uniref:hotdog domain-containing protein n=1 Tax=Nocardia alni TaxID=2815723 RepID=UPI001C2408D5|nr:hotdog domain-containing protein [Nocardia alni]